MFAKSSVAKAIPLKPNGQAAAATNDTVTIMAANTNDVILAATSGNSDPVPVISSTPMQTVTPQMLAAFLKPVQGNAGTNTAAGAEVLIPAEVGFTPPNPAQSRATYKTQ